MGIENLLKLNCDCCRQSSSIRRPNAWTGIKLRPFGKVIFVQNIVTIQLKANLIIEIIANIHIQ